MPNILIVEDDININNLLCEVLRKAGYTCEQAFSGTEAKLLLDIKEKAYTLVLLDLMLPGASGEEVLKEIRKQGRLPVIVLTAKDSMDDKIGVLTDGADDYITKERGMTICISSHILEELSKLATDYGIIHNGCLVQELTREELMKKCSERIELTLDNPKQAIPVLDDMGFSSYQVIDKEHIHIFERLGESARLNMELAKAGIPVKGISITSEELENYFLRLTGGDNRA